MDDFVHKYWPYLLGGGIAVLGLVWLFFSGSSSSSNTGASNFTYSVGPTDAQIAAGTAQQNQIQADQTAVSLANIQATAGTSENSANDSLLATLGSDQLSSSDENNIAAVSLANTQENEQSQDLASILTNNVSSTQQTALLGAGL
jgi:hypothetical protein